MSLETRLAQWLNGELEKRGWSIRQAAQRGGVSPTAINNVLLGHQVRLGTYKALARAFETPLMKILELAGEIPPRPEPVHDEDEVLRLYRRLDIRERRTVLAMLCSMLRESVADESDPRRGFPSADGCSPGVSRSCQVLQELRDRGELLTKSEFLEFIRSIDDPQVLRIVREEAERKWLARQRERRIEEEERAAHNDHP